MNKQSQYLQVLKKMILDNKEKISEMEFTSGNYDNSGKLIKEKIPTLTTRFCEIGVYKNILYFVFIIKSSSYRKSLFDSLKIFSEVQIYGFKNFNKILFPAPGFSYRNFKEQIKTDEYLQIKFDYNVEAIKPTEIYKEYQKIKKIFTINQVNITDQIKIDLSKS